MLKEKLTNITKNVSLGNMNLSSTNIEAKHNLKAAELPDWLLSQGISSVTTEDIANVLRIPKSTVPQRMAALRKHGEIVSPSRGLWIPVAPEYRSWGAPPAIELIDSLMEHLNTDYYIGWLSAASLLGASHHAPQVFQVATVRHVADRVIGRSRMQFYRRGELVELPSFNIETKSGAVPVSTKAVTLLDIVSDLNIVGGLDNAANLVIELCENEDDLVEQLIEVAPRYSAAAIRRLGWIVEKFTDISGMCSLVQYAQEKSQHPSVLDPSTSVTHEIDDVWNIDINREVEPDV